jgi:hypothetical protein
MSDSKCPHCGYDGDPWFTFVDLSICQKPDMSGARFEIRVRCMECKKHVDWPGEDFPGLPAEPSTVRQPADKPKGVVEIMFDSDYVYPFSMGCRCK